MQDLAQILQQRRFMCHRWPFPYVVGRDVFVPAFYEELAREFRALLQDGYEVTGGRERFGRNITGYDAMSLRFLPEYSGPLSIFYSRPFHDMATRLLGVESTRDVSGGLHHHPVGNRSGWIHNDLNPGWFLDRPRPDGMNFGVPAACDYQTGALSGGVQETPRPTVRTLAMLFYLNNEPWEPGDGGETGLFQYESDPSAPPVAAVPPINNTLLLFRCTPHSFHAFQHNRRKVRNSMVLWFHTPRQRIVEQYGEGAIRLWT